MTLTERSRFWNTHLNRQRRSGLPRHAYCAKHGLAVSSFGYWSRKQRVGATDVAPPCVAPRLVPVELVGEPTGLTETARSGVQLHTGAVHIDLAVGFDVPTLRRALEALGC